MPTICTWSSPLGISSFGEHYQTTINKVLILQCQLPDVLQDKIRAALGKAASKILLTHCRREIFQAAWTILLDDPEFMHTYHHGIVVDCADGVRRRLYPRIFTYSADYPEK